MLSSNEIRQRLEALKATLEKYDADQRALTAMIRQAPPRQRTDDLLDQISRAEDQMISEEELIRTRLEYQIQRHNLQHALLSEIAPAALEILSRYEGKPYGPKTRDKISQEMNKQTGWNMYISNYDYSGQTLHLSSSDMRGSLEVVSIGSPEGERLNFLSADNKINALSLDRLQIVGYHRPYVDDVPARVDDLIRAHAAAAAAAAAWREALSAYNSLIVKGIDQLQANDPYRAYKAPTVNI